MSNLLHNISVKPNFLCHGSRFDKDRVICTYEKPSSSEQTSPVSLQYQYNINQTSDENKGKILFGCNQLIQY